jgi:hypothetical protein
MEWGRGNRRVVEVNELSVELDNLTTGRVYSITRITTERRARSIKVILSRGT